MELETVVADYVEQVTGERPEITPVATADLDHLPVYLARTWRLRKMLLLGREAILALPKGGTKIALARLMKDCSTLSARLECEVIPVAPDIKSYERRRLVQKRIPFVVPGRQLFLPMFLADFREVFSVPAKPQAQFMSWISQLILLRHLLDGGIVGLPLTKVAGTLGYTAMAVTHGVKELVSLGLCTKVPKGRAITVRFDLEPAALWEAALSHMRSPAGRRYPVAMPDEQTADILDAGLSALSGKSNLAHSAPWTVALANRELKRLFAEGILETRGDESDAQQVIEGWVYNPKLLSDGPAVDELSLYLSLKDDPDERVQMALENMMEQRRW